MPSRCSLINHSPIKSYTLLLNSSISLQLQTLHLAALSRRNGMLLLLLRVIKQACPTMRLRQREFLTSLSVKKEAPPNAPF